MCNHTQGGSSHTGCPLGWWPRQGNAPCCCFCMGPVTTEVVHWELSCARQQDPGDAVGAGQQPHMCMHARRTYLPTCMATHASCARTARICANRQVNCCGCACVGTVHHTAQQPGRPGSPGGSVCACAAVHTGSHAQQCMACGWWVVWGPGYAASSSALPCTRNDVHCAASSTTHAAGAVLVCSQNARAAAQPAGVAAKPDLR